MMGQTSNYKWSQPEYWDGPARLAWSQTLSAIDAAVAAKADSSEVDSRFTSVNSSISSLNKRLEVRVGSYTGDGKETRTINLGFTPDAVLVEDSSSTRTDNTHAIYGGLALSGKPCGYGSNNYAVEVVTSGFRVGYTSGTGAKLTNVQGTSYRYLAWH